MSAPEGIVAPHDAPAQAQHKQRVMAELSVHPFRPAWWLRNRHAQTVWGPIFRWRMRGTLRRVRLQTPDDDFIDLHILDMDPQAPLVLMLHGLEGSADSFYLQGMNRRWQRLGWNSATLVFRSCGGEMNRGQRIYHMGETTDLAFTVDYLRETHPGKPLFLMGVSLGGNVLAKWLGEMGGRVPGEIAGAAVISPPFRPEVGAPQFHRELFGIYSRRFLRTLIPKALEKARQYPELLDPDEIRGCRDFTAFDTVVTARLHGFADAEDYWRKVGCGQFLPDIRVPTLLVASADDPFNPASTLPWHAVEASAWLHPLFTKRGGHVGFVGGSVPWRARYWVEEQVERFARLCQAMGCSGGACGPGQQERTGTRS